MSVGVDARSRMNLKSLEDVGGTLVGATALYNRLYLPASQPARPRDSSFGILASLSASATRSRTAEF